MTSHDPRPRSAVALRHVHFEDLGILEPFLTARGYRVEYVDAEAFDIAQLEDADLLVVLGGPIGVHDTETYPFLQAEKEVIARRLRARRPLLGICLGAQLIAEALGAEVRPTGRAEIGYAPLTLTEEGLDSPLHPLEGVPVLHWHGDAFTITDDARHLAGTPGFPNQAFSTDSALALQFHLEADPRAIERWLIGHAHELQHHGIDPRTIRADAVAYGPELEEAARRAVGLWLDGFDKAAGPVTRRSGL